MSQMYSPTLSDAQHTNTSYSRQPPNKPIRFAQLNLNGRAASTDMLLNSIVGDADVVITQHPFWRTGYEQTHPSFEHLVPSFNHIRPRATFWVTRTRPDLSFSLLSTVITDLTGDAAVLEVRQANSDPFIIVNVYNEKPLDKNIHQEYTMTRIFNELASLSTRCIITGDMNAHHTLWDSEVQSPARHKELLELVESGVYHLVNEFDVRTFHSFNIANRPTVIDLTLVTTDLLQFIDEWAVDGDRNPGSDHELIWFSLQQRPSPDEYANHPTTQPYVWKEVDWDTFREALTTSTAEFADIFDALCDTPSGIDHCIEMLTRSIQTVMEENLPKRKPSPRAKRWWNKELEELRHIMNTARRLHQHMREERHAISYRSLRNRYQRAVKKAKRDCWAKYLDSLRGVKVFDVYRYLKPKSSKKLSAIVEDGVTYESWDDMEKIIRQKMFPHLPSSDTNTSQEDLDLSASQNIRHSLALPDNTSVLRPKWNANGNTCKRPTMPHSPLTMPELEKAIFSSNSWTASGPDKIPFAVLKETWHVLKLPLFHIMKACVDIGYHPETWRSALVAIIPKVNKVDRSKVSSNRPISLLNCMGKTLERIVAGRISRYCEKYQVLHSSQTGCRPHHSCSDAMAALAHHVQTAHDNSLKASSWFADVKGAFNHVIHERLISTMKEEGFPDPVIEWVRSFLTGRKAALVFNGQTGELQIVEVGVPQGSPASGTLFNIYMCPLFFELDRLTIPGLKSFFPLSYVDDIELGVASYSHERNVRLIKVVHNFMIQWGKANGVTFDEVKMELMHWQTRGKEQHADLPVDIGGTRFLPKRSMRWLGFHIDPKLNWAQHCKIRLEQGRKAWNAIRSNCYQEGGIHPVSVKHVYKACIMPTVSYGSSCWFSRDSQTKGLDVLQNKALCKSLEGVSWSPTFALQVEAAIPPAHLALRDANRRELVRWTSLPKHHLIKRILDGPTTPGSHSRVAYISSTMDPEIIRDLEPIDFYLDDPHAIDYTRFRSSSPAIGNKEEAKSMHLEFLARRKEDITCAYIYSDGSKDKDNRRSGSAAALHYCGTRISYTQESLRNEVESYETELVGIELGLIILQKALQTDLSLHVRTVYIWLDNDSAVSTCVSLDPGPGQYLRARIRRLASHILQQYDVSLFVEWIPGHCNIKGNEEVDSLAKGAAYLPGIRKYWVSRAWIKRERKRLLIQDWKNYATRCIHEPRQGAKVSTDYSRIFKGTQALKLRASDWTKNADRKSISRLFQIISGKGFFGGGYASSSIETQQYMPCPHCDDPCESVSHIIKRCPAYNRQRSDTIAKIHRHCNLRDILSHPKGHEELDKFLIRIEACDRSKFHQRLRVQREPRLSESTDSIQQ